MADSDFELDIEPSKAAPQVAPWMLVVAILAFCGFTTVLVLQTMEYMYMRGQIERAGDPHAEVNLLPE